MVFSNKVSIFGSHFKTLTKSLLFMEDTEKSINKLNAVGIANEIAAKGLEVADLCQKASDLGLEVNVRIAPRFYLGMIPEGLSDASTTDDKWEFSVIVRVKK